MGRGRGKGKKIGGDDYVSGEDEKLPTKRRGRPQKRVKDEIEWDDEGEGYEDGEVAKSWEMGKNSKNQVFVEKRKRPENDDLIKEETKTNANVLIKSVSFRQIGSRRKNKPRRAAEVGVECK